jgi:acetolactate synthase regulatory subunit
MRHTISVLVENRFGVLSRVAGLFSGRGYNIESLTVARTLDPDLSHMTIVVDVDPSLRSLVIKQMNKLINVLQAAMASAERIFGLLDTQVEVRAKAVPVRLPRVEGRVAFEGVSFAYGDGHDVLRDVSFSVEPGIYLPGLGGVRIEDMVRRHGASDSERRESANKEPEEIVEIMVDLSVKRKMRGILSLQEDEGCDGLPDR